MVGSAQHNFRHVADNRILGNLSRHIRSEHRHNLRPQKLRQLHVVSEGFLRLFPRLLSIRRLHTESCQSSVKGVRQTGSRPYYFGAGGCRRDADQDMLSCVIVLALQQASLLLGNPVDAIRASSQGNLPESRQPLSSEKILKRPVRLLLPVDFPLLHPLDQIFRFNINHFYLIRVIKYRVWNPLPHVDMGNASHQVVKTLQMLDIQSCVDADSGPQKLLHILVPLFVSAAPAVGVGQLVHQKQLRLPL